MRELCCSQELKFKFDRAELPRRRGNVTDDSGVEREGGGVVVKLAGAKLSAVPRNLITVVVRETFG